MRRTSIDAGRKAQCVRTPPDLDEGPAEEPDAGVDGGQPSFVRAKPISLRPALVVLACAVVITVGGFAVALVGTGQSQPAVVKGLGTPVPGVSLSAVGATSVLQAITSGGTPPSDVLGALVVPGGARIVGTSSQDASVDQYDRSMRFQVTTTSSQLVSFYRIELKRAHWSMLGTYKTSKSATEVLAQRAGSDGYEWEVGAEVAPSNPSLSPALAGDSVTSAVMNLTLRLFEVPDGD